MMEADKVLYRLERKGVYTIDSIFFGMGYAIKDNNVAIFAGKSGDLRINLDNADMFLEELTDVIQIARERKGKKVAGI